MTSHAPPGDPLRGVTVIASLTNGSPWTRPLQNKAPRVTPLFWIATVFASTLGATAADAVSADLALGRSATSAIVSLLLVSVLIWQISTSRCRGVSYWLSVVLCSTTGTLFADTLGGNLGVGPWAATSISCVALGATLISWQHCERTVSVSTLITRRREVCCWIAILSAYVLGSAIQDLVAHTLKLGHASTVLLFAGAMVLAAVAGTGHRVPGVTAFWAAYVVACPLGAVLSDLLTATPRDGGLGLGTNATSASLMVLILIVLGAAPRHRHQSGLDQVGSAAVSL